MESRDLTSLGLDPGAAAALGAYLAELDSLLPVGKHTRRQIVAELADGLACAVSDHIERGALPADAAAAAIAESGSPRLVAAAFTSQLAPAAAYKTGLGLVTTGPLVGLTWVAAYATAGRDWLAQIAGVLSALPQLPFILVVTVPAAVMATTGAGWVARHLAVPSRIVTGAAAVAAMGCVAGDLSLLVNAFGQVELWQRPSPFLVLAVAASGTRLSLAAFAWQRIARLRAALN